MCSTYGMAGLAVRERGAAVRLFCGKNCAKGCAAHTMTATKIIS